MTLLKTLEKMNNLVYSVNIDLKENEAVINVQDRVLNVNDLQQEYDQSIINELNEKQINSNISDMSDKQKQLVTDLFETVYTGISDDVVTGIFLKNSHEDLTLTIETGDINSDDDALHVTLSVSIPEEDDETLVYYVYINGAYAYSVKNFTDFSMFYDTLQGNSII